MHLVYRCSLFVVPKFGEMDDLSNRIQPMLFVGERNSLHKCRQININSVLKKNSNKVISITFHT